MKSNGAVGVMVVVAAVAVTQAFAQETDRPPMEQVGREGPRMRPAGPQRGGMFEGREGRSGGPRVGSGGGEEALLARILTNPKVAETLGLSQEQIKTLQEKLTAVRKEIATLQVDLDNASMEQARLLTATQTVDEAAVMTAIEKAGEIRTKIAKLMVQQLLAVKKTLTPAQIEKARDLRREFQEKNRERLSAPRDQGETGEAGKAKRPRDRGARGSDEGRPPEGHGENQPPPPPERAM